LLVRLVCAWLLCSSRLYTLITWCHLYSLSSRGLSGVNLPLLPFWVRAPGSIPRPGLYQRLKCLAPEPDLTAGWRWHSSVLTDAMVINGETRYDGRRGFSHGPQSSATDDLDRVLPNVRTGCCVQRFFKCKGENGALRCDQFLSPSSVERCKSAVNTRNLETNIDDYQSTISMEV
jgi:hypothetical protein